LFREEYGADFISNGVGKVIGVRKVIDIGKVIYI
jgi:hypothetical protein